MKNLVSFKSQQPFFNKECDGRKPNTIRKLSEDDPRRKTLLDWLALDQFGEIEIVLSGGSSGFTRSVSDVSLYEDWFIICWYTPRQVTCTETKVKL